MSCLILVRHALPNIDPDVPSVDWTLSVSGREAATKLAEALAGYSPRVVLGGPEPKVIGTAEIIAEHFGLRARMVPALAKHARRSAGYVSQADFEAAVGLLFDSPAQVVYGEESADIAHERFASAIDRALAVQDNDSVLAVTGGTVISLFISRRGGIRPFPLWRSLRMPTALVLNCENWKIITSYHQTSEFPKGSSATTPVGVICQTLRVTTAPRLFAAAEVYNIGIRSGRAARSSLWMASPDAYWL